MNLAQVLEAGRTRHPNAVAIHNRGQHLPYDRVFHDVERIAGLLVEQGLRVGDVVAVDIRRPVSHWLLLLALLRIGATSVSLTDNFAAELAALPDLKAAIVGPEPRVSATMAPVIEIDGDWLRRAPGAGGSLPEPRRAAASLGRIAFTSGTTGRAKGVRLDSGLLHARLADTGRRSLLNARSVLWCGLGPDTAYGFTATLACWLEGAAMVFPPAPEGTFGYLSAMHVNLMIASPAALAVVIRDAASGTLPPLPATTIVAGGRLPVAMRDALFGRVCTDVRVAYGSSEAGGVTLGSARGLDADPGNVGRVFADVEAEIVDERGEPVPYGQAGRLRVRSRSTASAYLGDPAGTAAHFVDGWFEPGDVGRLSAEGDLTIVGRVTDLLNVGGVKLQAGELEAAARLQDGVEDACALIDPTDGTLLIAVTGAPPTTARFGAGLRAIIPATPRFRLVWIADLPRGTMGKVDRTRLTAALADMAASGAVLLGTT